MSFDCLRLDDTLSFGDSLLTVNRTTPVEELAHLAHDLVLLLIVLLVNVYKAAVNEISQLKELFFS